MSNQEVLLGWKRTILDMLETEEDTINGSLFQQKEPKWMKLDANDQHIPSEEHKHDIFSKPVDDEEEVSLWKAIETDLNIKTPADLNKNPFKKAKHKGKPKPEPEAVFND